MQYSDTTNKSGLLQDCEFLTGLGDAYISGNTTPKAQFTANINNWYQKVADMIIDSCDDIVWDDANKGTEAIITKSLTANQNYVALAVSDKILRVLRVEVSYDGSNWYKAEPISQAEIASPIGNQTDVNRVFQTTKPYYEIRGLYLYLYPVPTLSQTNFLKIWVKRDVDLFTTSDTTKVPGFDATFHRMLSLGASYDFAVVKSLPQVGSITNLLQDFEARLRRAYGKKDEDRHYQMKAAYINYD